MEELEMRLIADTKKIKRSFANLTHSVKRSLEHLQIPVPKIKVTILSLDAFIDDAGISFVDQECIAELGNAQTLDEIFLVLWKFMSFFNTEIMDYLVYQHGTAADQERLAAYEDEFESFCRRNVFEVPKNAFLRENYRRKSFFVFKCLEQSVYTLNCVNTVRAKIAKILGLKPISLQLATARKGCVEESGSSTLRRAGTSRKKR